MNGASRVASIEAGRERAYSGKATGVAFPFEPSKKHTQQDEGGVVQDEEERKVITERRRARIHVAGSSYTARANTYGAAHGLMSAHGREYSARVPKAVSQTKAAKIAAQTARAEAEQRTRREAERQQREKARKAALRAAAKRDAELQAEREKREAARETERKQEEYYSECQRQASEHACKHVPALGFNVIPPSEKELRRRRRRNRPEWGEDHAGGNRMGLASPQRSSHRSRASSQGNTASSERDEEEEESEYAVDVTDGAQQVGTGGVSPPAPLWGASGIPSLGIGGGGGGGGGPPGGLFKLDLPREADKTGYKGFTQLQEWKWSKVEKPRVVNDATRAADEMRSMLYPNKGHHGQPHQQPPQQQYHRPGDWRTYAAQQQGRLGSGMLAWMMGNGPNEEEEGLTNEEVCGGGGGGGEEKVEGGGGGGGSKTKAGSPSELKASLHEHVVSESDDSLQKVVDILKAARDMCKEGMRHDNPLEGKHVALAEIGFAHTVVAAMSKHTTSEPVQLAGCEVLSLLANNYWGLEQLVFDAGALEACLAACEQFGGKKVSQGGGEGSTAEGAVRTRYVESLLSAAYHAIHNICSAEAVGDKPGCLRKQKAVDLGALETIAHGMAASNSRKVHQAGKAAIGCLTKGIDKDGAARRKRAHALFRLSASSHAGVPARR